MHIEAKKTPLPELLGKEIENCACGKLHRIPTREVQLTPGAILQLPQIVGW